MKEYKVGETWIDVCNLCSGVWFDRQEFESLAGMAGQARRVSDGGKTTRQDGSAFWLVGESLAWILAALFS